MSGDEFMDLGRIDEFPFQSINLPTPEMAAQSISEIFCSPKGTYLW